MEITFELFVKIITFLQTNISFNFPFKICILHNNDEIDIYPNSDLLTVDFEFFNNENTKIFLYENLNNIDIITTKLMSKGFIDYILEQAN